MWAPVCRTRLASPSCWFWAFPSDHKRQWWTVLGRHTGMSHWVCCLYIGFNNSLGFWIFSFQSIIFDEVDLTDASVAESSTKNVNNSFTVGFFALFSILLASFPHISPPLQSLKTSEQSSQPLSPNKKNPYSYFSLQNHNSSPCTWEKPWVTMYSAKTLHSGIFLPVSWEDLIKPIYTVGQKTLFCWRS